MVRLTDCPDMTLDVYHGRKATTQQQHCEELRSYDLSLLRCSQKMESLNHMTLVCSFWHEYLSLKSYDLNFAKMGRKIEEFESYDLSLLRWAGN